MFKVFVTQLGVTSAKWDLAIFQGDRVYFPLTAKTILSPGSRIPLPGAFSLDGKDAAEICFFTGKHIPRRAQLRAEKRQLIPEAAICTHLVPVTKKSKYIP